MARLLKRFEIYTRDVREGLKVAKGYLREHFADAFSRYLPAAPQNATALQPHESGPQAGISDRGGHPGPDRYTATDGADCRGVAVERISNSAD